MLNAVDVGSVRPPLDATSVYPVPTLSIESPENVATPLIAATVAVPASVPPLGFAPIATVTFPVNPVAVFPCPSRAVTCTAGVMLAPATVVVGCTANTSCVAFPAVMLNALLVPVRPPLLAPSV